MMNAIQTPPPSSIKWHKERVEEYRRLVGNGKTACWLIPEYDVACLLTFGDKTTAKVTVGANGVHEYKPYMEKALAANGIEIIP